MDALKTSETLVFQVHTLKTDPAPWWDICSGRKTFEFRKDDRGYSVGDVLILAEHVPGEGFTGMALFRRVTSLLRGGYGVPDGYVVLSLGELRADKTVRLELASRDEEG
jgi:hypothetical protein